MSQLLSSHNSIVSVDDWKWVHNSPYLPMRHNIPKSRKYGWIADNAVTVMTNFVLMSRKRKPLISNLPSFRSEPIQKALMELADTVHKHGGAYTFVFDRGYTSADSVLACTFEL